MALPFLPGYSHNKHLPKERSHKSQHFDYNNGVPMLVADGKPGNEGETLMGQKLKPKYSFSPNKQMCDSPPWLAFDKQVLCFEAYFQEVVPEAQNETHRVRRCNIYFYLEDGTIQVVELRFKNSGIPQGTLIHRQRIPLPPPDDEQFYNVLHFNVNQQMVLYSRLFTVTDCDAFTRNFLTKLGVRLNDPVAIPDDPYISQRERIEKSMNPLRPYERQDRPEQFLDHDRKVLRFFCSWIDPKDVQRGPRQLVLRYFLADDTIAIHEVNSPRSGRNAVSKFLHRSKLPKHGPTQMKKPGEITRRTVLNVISSTSQGDRYLLDSLKTGAVTEEFYTDSELMIGKEVNVWGRKVIIADCDDFTKEHYRAKYGIEDFTPVPCKAPPAPELPRPVPPYNGYGSEEDSLSSCRGLIPKPPQKDFHKFIEKDRRGLESNVLTFRAKMVTADEVDRDRVFIVAFYLSDDSISVFERAQKNTGVLGGKFLERGRVKKPGQELFKSQPSEFFTAQDLYIGASLCLNSWRFQLLQADEYTLNYMERHAEEFPKANVGNILSKLRSLPAEKQSEMRKFLALADPSNTGFIQYEAFRRLLSGLECQLSEHEVLVLARSFAELKQPEVDVGLMLAVTQDLLRKKRFEDFPDMTRAFMQRDRNKTGRASFIETRTICKAFKLPLPENLLGDLLRKYADGEEIDYNAFLAGINWLGHPAPPVVANTFTLDIKSGLEDAGPRVANVKYSSLLSDALSLPSHVANPPLVPSVEGGGEEPMSSSDMTEH